MQFDPLMSNTLLCMFIFLLSLSGFLIAWLITKRLIPDKAQVSDVSRRYVLVTGCGSGFGKLAVQRLDHCGFHVFATCRTESSEQEIRMMCSDRVKTYRMDVTSRQDLERVYHQVNDEIPSDQGLWGLINNAGILNVGPIDWQPLDTFKRTADVNLWGLIDVTKTFLPLIKKAKGRVVNMASTLGRIALPYMASYAISKYGVDAFTDALRREMQPWKVQVISIEAGGHKTKLVNGKHLEQQWKDLWEGLDENKKKDYAIDCGYQGAKEMLRFDSMMSNNLNGVVDAMVTSLTARTPSSRYVIGMDANVFLWLVYLPTRFVDWMLSLVIRPLKPRE